jgi:hypothetical protein
MCMEFPNGSSHSNLAVNAFLIQYIDVDLQSCASSYHSFVSNLVSISMQHFLCSRQRTGSVNGSVDQSSIFPDATADAHVFINFGQFAQSHRNLFV